MRERERMDGGREKREKGWRDQRGSMRERRY